MSTEFAVSEPLDVLAGARERSALASEAATRLGFTDVFDVTERRESGLDAQPRRGRSNGWRRRDLPVDQGMTAHSMSMSMSMARRPR